MDEEIRSGWTAPSTREVVTCAIDGATELERLALSSLTDAAEASQDHAGWFHAAGLQLAAGVLRQFGQPPR